MLRPPARWLPRLLGIVSTLLAIAALLDFLLVPAVRSEQVLFGYRLVGVSARMVASLCVAFFAWMAWACFARRRVAVYAVVGYVLYLIESLWVWTFLYGHEVYKSGYGPIVINSFVSAALLAFGRYLWDRRTSFNR